MHADGQPPGPYASARCALPAARAFLVGGGGRRYAIKIMNKHLIMRNKVVEYIKNERNILDKLDDPGVARLHFTFQDADNLCEPMRPMHDSCMSRDSCATRVACEPCAVGVVVVVWALGMGRG